MERTRRELVVCHTATHHRRQDAHTDQLRRANFVDFRSRRGGLQHGRLDVPHHNLWQWQHPASAISVHERLLSEEVDQVYVTAHFAFVEWCAIVVILVGSNRCAVTNVSNLARREESLQFVRLATLDEPLLHRGRPPCHIVLVRDDDERYVHGAGYKSNNCWLCSSRIHVRERRFGRLVSRHDIHDVAEREVHWLVFL